MAIPTAISSSSSGLSSQIQTQQVQRAADQATQRAQSLQVQAREARANAARAQSNARSLESSANSAQNAANQAHLNAQNSAGSSFAQFRLNTAYSELPQKVALESPAASQVASSSEQNIGSLIDTTA